QAEVNKSNLGNGLTPAEISEARRLADDWLAGGKEKRAAGKGGSGFGWGLKVFLLFLVTAGLVFFWPAITRFEFRDEPVPAPEAELPAAAMIMEAQSLLNQLGYDAGVPDGIMGPRTETAIRAFERDQSLTGTGRVDAFLISRLKAELGSGEP
ncbi:MAG: peptidoglycan-binding domain-containing protein, partial [Sphingomonadales bacterium]